MRNMRWMIACALLCTAGFAAETVPAPAALTTDNLVNPLVTQDLTPRLGWKLPWKQRGAAQSAYQVLAASDPSRLVEGKADLWDSGKVTSDASVLLSYGGKALSSGETVWWTVRVWNESGRVSRWSEPAHFTTAKPYPVNWSAKWITYPDAAFADDRLFRDHQRHIPVPAYPKVPRVSRDDAVDGYINDAAFGAGSSRWPGAYKGTNGLDWTKDRLEEIPPSPMFRKEFDFAAKPRRVLLYASALGWQEIYVNGQRVGEGVNNPSPTDYDRRALYEVFDVTDMLKEGRNAIGVWVGGGWYQQGVAFAVPPERRQINIYGRPGLLLEVNYELADGKSGRLVSDETWQCSLAGPVLKDNFYVGCFYDARRELPGWTQTGFNADCWAVAETITQPQKPPLLIGGRPCPPVPPEIDPACLPPVRMSEPIKPASLTEVSPGVWLFDPGTYVTGYIRLSHINASAGAAVSIRYHDSLDANGRLTEKPVCAGELAAGAHKLDRYICKGTGNESFEPKFVFRGFCYAEITGLPPGVKPRAEAVNLRTAVTRNGEFVCSDPEINDFQSMFLRTEKTNMHGLISDSPTRERNQWLGVHGPVRNALNWNFDMYPFWWKIIRDNQTATITRKVNGKEYPNFVRNVSANMRPAGLDPQWAMFSILTPWTAYEFSGDREMLEKCYPYMRDLLAFCEAAFPDGIVVELEPWLIGDWLEEGQDSSAPGFRLGSLLPGLGKRTSVELIESMAYYESAAAAFNTARLIGRPDESEHYRALADHIRKAIIGRFYNREKYTYGTQSGDAMALDLGLYPDGDREALLHSLLGEIQERGGHLSTGIICTPRLLRVLAEADRPAVTDALWSLLTTEDYPGFGFMRRMGAKTTWETWGNNIVSLEALKAGRRIDSGSSISQSELSASSEFFYQNVAGIRPDPEHPGFKHFVLRPGFGLAGHLDQARADYESPYGKISSAWKNEGSKLVWTVVVPPNTAATIYIPASSAESVTESGKPLAKAEGVKFTKIENGRAVCELQPGTYRFDSIIKQRAK